MYKELRDDSVLMLIGWMKYWRMGGSFGDGWKGCSERVEREKNKVGSKGNIKLESADVRFLENLRRRRWREDEALESSTRGRYERPFNG